MNIHFNTFVVYHLNNQKMFGSKLIEKLISDASISVRVEHDQYTVFLNSTMPLFQICKDSFEIKLTMHTWDLITQTEDNLCNVLLCTYLKLNYLTQHGYMKLFVEGNETMADTISVKKIQNCLSFFEELKGEKKSNLSEHQLNAIRIYGTKMHQSFSRV